MASVSRWISRWDGSKIIFINGSISWKSKSYRKYAREKYPFFGTLDQRQVSLCRFNMDSVKSEQVMPWVWIAIPTSKLTSLTISMRRRMAGTQSKRRIVSSEFSRRRRGVPLISEHSLSDKVFVLWSSIPMSQSIITHHRHRRKIFVTSSHTLIRNCVYPLSLNVSGRHQWL